jgi:hypothetical protein
VVLSNKYIAVKKKTMQIKLKECTTSQIRAPQEERSKVQQ